MGFFYWLHPDSSLQGQRSISIYSLKHRKSCGGRMVCAWKREKKNKWLLLLQYHSPVVCEPLGNFGHNNESFRSYPRIIFLPSSAPDTTVVRPWWRSQSVTDWLTDCLTGWVQCWRFWSGFFDAWHQNTRLHEPDMGGVLAIVHIAGWTPRTNRDIASSHSPDRTNISETGQ